MWRGSVSVWPVPSPVLSMTSVIWALVTMGVVASANTSVVTIRQLDLRAAVCDADLVTGLLR